MRSVGSSTGFTIIEVLIVITVSGLLVTSALAFISGRQGQAQFSQGLNDFDSQISESINNVENGFYPGANSDNLKCTFSTSSTPPYSINNSGSNSRGSNFGANSNGCIFLGEVINFNNSYVNSSGSWYYKSYTMVAPAILQNGQSSTGILCGGCSNPKYYPIVIAPNGNSIPDYSQSSILNGGLAVKEVYYGTQSQSSQTTEGAIIAFNSQGSYSTGPDSNLQSGSHQLSLYYTGQSITDVASDVGVIDNALGNISTSGGQTTNEINICVVDSIVSPKYSALVVIQNGGGQLSSSAHEVSSCP